MHTRELLRRSALLPTTLTTSVVPEIRAKIEFKRYDLLADQCPVNAYDLIVCRNVVIYFNEDAKTRIFRNFFTTLRPGGVLLVGGTERIVNHSSIGYKIMCPYCYRKEGGMPTLTLVKTGTRQ